jgi:predicted DNA-binding ribbon-helix-helix protein
MERVSSADGGRVKSTLKRSIRAGARKFSVSLEDEFWDAFKQIAAARNIELSELVGAINKERQHPNLSSAIRVFVLDHYRALAERRVDQANAA